MSKNKWHHVSKIDGAIRQEDLFTGGYIFPVQLFLNEDTAEVKFFATKMVKDIGIKNVLKQLNK